MRNSVAHVTFILYQSIPLNKTSHTTLQHPSAELHYYEPRETS